MRNVLICTLVLTIAAVAAPAEESLYALSGYTNGRLLKLDPATGALLESHDITNDEALFGGLAADAAGDIYSIDGYNDPNSDRLFRIDRATGAGTVVGDTGENWNFRFIYAHPVNDVLYSGRDNRLYTTDRTTGAVTYLADITGSTLDQVTALAIDSQGNAYVTDIGNTGLFSVDLNTGQATHIGDVGQSSNWFADLAFDSNDVLWGVRANSGGVYTIDVGTAVETFAFSGTYKGLTFIGGTMWGDMNCDGAFNGADIDPFFLALGDPVTYMVQFPNCNINNGDMNGDGAVNGADIDPFFECLGGGVCP